MPENFEVLSSASVQTLKRIIYTIRGFQVMLDSDLAALYKVETKAFNQAVKRNIERFPESFRFQLTTEEYQNLRSQFVTSSGEGAGDGQHGGRRYLPYVFTEQGVAMLSSVLHSEFAIQTSIKIMNAFVEMRHVIASTSTLFSRLETLERRQIADQYENDKKFDLIFEALDRKPEPDHGIFFDGQIYDAYTFVNNLISKATSEIVLIDGYVDDIDIVENWRASHRHILNVWQVILRKRATAEQSFMSCMYKKNSALFHAEFYNSQTVRIQEAGASAFFAALLTREARRDFFLSALFLWKVPDLTALSRAAY